MSLFFPTKKPTLPSVNKPLSDHDSEFSEQEKFKKFGEITKSEFRHVIGRLRGDMSNFKIKRFIETASGYQDKDYGHRGITAKEASDLLKYLEVNRHQYNFSNEDISDIKNALNREL